MARAADREDLLRRLGHIRAQSPRRWGRMNAHQMICHLSDSFGSVLGIRSAARGGSAFERIVIKRVALYGPVPWPRGFRTRPEVDQEKEGTPPGDFAADLERLKQRFTQFAELDDFPYPHPMFGRMTRNQWLRWGYLHMNHHLRQFGV